MQEITEEQINKASAEYLDDVIGYQDRNSEHAEIDFYNGFMNGMEAMQPKWVTVSGIADLPTEDKIFWCEVNSNVILLSADSMRRGTRKIKRYTPFVNPVPPAG